MIGTFAALAWLIASSVWGMTPSSAATTTTAMSVTFAPRARIAVNASWPGVSRKTTRLPSCVDLARADVLGDAAPLAGRDLGRPDRVEEARLAVVDVAHDRHDRARAADEVGRVVLVEEDFLGRRAPARPPPRRRRPMPAVGRDRLGDLVAELARDERRGVAVDELVDRREDAALDQLADHVRGVDREQLRELLDGDRRRQLDRATLARVGDLDLRRYAAAVATRRLAGSAPAAGAAPTPGHGAPPSSLSVVPVRP